jgi:2,3-bisphosphoglycerate-dependent phosphoglycerate mutase
MTTIYFVRHAEPLHSWEDDRTRPLTEEGQRDANRITAFFGDKKIDALISSPYKRSYETILPTAAMFNKQIATDARLRERKAGSGGNNRELFYKRRSDKNFAEDDGECIASVQKRNIAALNEILENNKDKTLIIGTHGTALSSIINYFNPKFGCDDFLRIINFMPYIVEMTFHENTFLEMEEKVIIKKAYKG